MQYNFDEIVNRENTDSVKFDLRADIFGDKEVIPMWVADMDFKTPDFIIQAIQQRAKHEVLGYSFRSKAYHESIVNWLYRHHQWKINSDWISFSPGIVPAINMAVQAFTKPGDNIIIQPPVYFPFFGAIKNNERNQVENPLVLRNGRYYIDFEDLEPKLKNAKVLILSNPHNPGGSVWTKEELKKLGELCLKNDVIVFSDEIHGDLVYKGFEYTPMASLSDEIAQNTITFIAPSKTFNMAALATSSVITSNKALKDKYDKVLDVLHVGMGNVFGSVASVAAYNHGDQWLCQLLDYLSNNLDYAQDYIEMNIPEVTFIRPEGTYLVWLDCSKLNMDSEALKKFMIEKAKLGFNAGDTFGTGGEQFMRMNIACPKSTLIRALENLKEAICKLRNR
ncbi:MAG: PatB family C-S lyase [Bacteroidales bacterium]|nr:PatB family C-S lyase [Bacteroidales bacterium]